MVLPENNNCDLFQYNPIKKRQPKCLSSGDTVHIRIGIGTEYLIFLDRGKQMTNPSEALLEQIKMSWQLGSQLRFIRKVENWIYKDEEKQLFIRITEPSHRSESQLKSELNWMFFLQKQGVKFAHPVPSLRNRLVEEFSDDKDKWYASVFREARGIPLYKKEDFTAKRLNIWGRLIGQLHSATLDYQKPAHIEPRCQWNSERAFLYNQEVFSPDHSLYSQYQRLINWLSQHPKTKHNYGLIHADIHQGNFLVDESDEFTLFDFDDCHYHWFAYDLATPLFGLSMSMRESCSREEIEEMHRCLFAGYRETGVLREEELELIPHFILYRHFSIYTFAWKNLENHTLSERTKDWMHMALAFCRSFIESYDTDTLVFREKLRD